MDNFRNPDGIYLLKVNYRNTRTVSFWQKYYAPRFLIYFCCHEHSLYRPPASRNLQLTELSLNKILHENNFSKPFLWQLAPISTGSHWILLWKLIFAKAVGKEFSWETVKYDQSAVTLKRSSDLFVYLWLGLLPKQLRR